MLDTLFYGVLPVVLVLVVLLAARGKRKAVRDAAFLQQSGEKRTRYWKDTYYQLLDVVRKEDPALYDKTLRKRITDNLDIS